MGKYVNHAVFSKSCLLYQLCPWDQQTKEIWEQLGKNSKYQRDNREAIHFKTEDPKE